MIYFSLILNLDHIGHPDCVAAESHNVLITIKISAARTVSFGIDILKDLKITFKNII
jgi:hypothetical protein